MTSLWYTEALKNGLCVVQSVTDGNCAPSAFVRSALSAVNIRQQPWRSWKQLGHAAAITQARKMAVDWLRENRERKLHSDISMQLLVQAVSGVAMDHYLERMAKSGCWGDTAFLHALACACNVEPWLSGSRATVFFTSCGLASAKSTPFCAGESVL